SDQAEVAKRSWHASALIGGFIGVTGPASYGTAVDIEIYPPARFGGNLIARDLAGSHGTLVLAGLAFQAAATRPRLVMSLHADIGATTGDTVLPAAGGGVRAQLAVFGPIIIGGNLTGHLLLDGIDTTLAIAVTAGAGLAF
ncbi:MAG: hypothetical protein AAGC55_07175, partial [Myxococcota bacterium]